MERVISLVSKRKGLFLKFLSYFSFTLGWMDGKWIIMWSIRTNKRNW